MLIYPELIDTTHGLEGSGTKPIRLLFVVELRNPLNIETDSEPPPTYAATEIFLDPDLRTLSFAAVLFVSRARPTDTLNSAARVGLWEVTTDSVLGNATGHPLPEFSSRTTVTTWTWCLVVGTGFRNDAQKSPGLLGRYDSLIADSQISTVVQEIHSTCWSDTQQWERGKRAPKRDNRTVGGIGAPGNKCYYSHSLPRSEIVSDPVAIITVVVIVFCF